MNNRIYFLILTGIVLLAFCLRFYKLGEIPFGFYQDESAIGYNAYSLLTTGHDEHGVPFPLYFKSFGDYKLPVYIYSVVPAVALFGLTEFAVRLPSALFGVATIIAFYFFVRKLTKNQWLSLIATSLLAINPWHLHYSRATFEVNIGLFLYILGVYFLVKAFENGKRGAFFAGVLCFIIGLYSYNLTRLLSPVLFLATFYLYRNNKEKIAKSEYLITLIASILLLIPFITTFFTSSGVSSAGGTLIFSSAPIQAALLELRSYFVSLPTLFTKLFFNTFFLTLWQYINNIASYLSIPFFFVTGSSHGNHGIGNAGQFYLFELPFITFGIVAAMRRRERWQALLLVWAAVVVLIGALTREAPHATRSFFLLGPLEVFSAMGAVAIWQWIRSVKYRGILFAVAGVLVIYNLIYYLSSYYVRFPIAYAKAWRSADKPLSLYLWENEEKYDKIIFDKSAGFIYSSLLFYSAYPPDQFQKTAIWEPDDSEGFSMVQAFGKYEFKDVDWANDYTTAHTLIVTSKDNKPKELPVLQTFYYPSRPVVVAIKQKIAQYPVQDSAYVLVETKQ